MVDLTATNVALGGESSKRSKAWLSLLESTLNNAAASVASKGGGNGAGDLYECVAMRYLVGVMIAVYVKTKHRGAVRDVKDAVAPVGVMGVMGNKGGASVRLRVYDTTACFVCAHLAAHRGAVAQRNADFSNIMAKTEFVDDALTEAGAAGGAPGGGGGGGGPGTSGGPSTLGAYGVSDHDIIVWFGDFNYRIVESVSTERCFELAAGGEAELDTLRARDQCVIERTAGRVFPGFSEGPLTFRPTYKFQPGSSVYEQRPEKKLRAPAWCDRILWKTGPGVDPRHFRQLYYGSVDGIMLSDHKPVHALFEAAAKTVQPAKRAAVLADVTRALDAMENRSMPRVHVSETSITLTDVVYGTPASHTLVLTNEGEVAVTWRFVAKLEERVFAKTWLTVDPPYGMLPPGQAATIDLRVTVDDAVARDISLGREMALLPQGATGTGPALGGLLEDILILRLERGRDYYLCVSAHVLPTAFGCSLSQLARRPEPMRGLVVTSAATLSAQNAAGMKLGAIPPATLAAAGGSAPIMGSRLPSLSAGSHMLASMLAEDDTDAAPLEDLASPGGGPSSSAMHASANASRKGSPLMSLPKEIWRLVDVLYNR